MKEIYSHCDSDGDEFKVKDLGNEKLHLQIRMALINDSCEQYMSFKDALDMCNKLKSYIEVQRATVKINIGDHVVWNGVSTDNDLRKVIDLGAGGWPIAVINCVSSKILRQYENIHQLRNENLYMRVG